MSSERFQTSPGWKDSLSYLFQKKILNEPKGMLVESLLGDEVLEENGNGLERVNNTPSLGIERYQKYCEEYYQNKGKITTEGVSIEHQYDEDNPTTGSIPVGVLLLENILSSLSSTEIINQYIPTIDYTLLHLSIQFHDYQTMKLLLNFHANPSHPDQKHGNISLHYAAINGKYEMIKLLLDANASINYQNLIGKTALHYSCEYGYEECVRVLLEYKKIPIKMDLRDHNGNTPLHLSCIDGNLSIVQYLLCAGCDHTIRNNDHKSALDVVLGMTHREAIRRELESHTNPLERVKVSSPSSQSNLFDGMEVKGPPKEADNDDKNLFSGLTLSQSPLPTHVTTTYIQNKFDNPEAIPSRSLVPEGRWVVIQSRKFIIDLSSAKLIIHRNKKSAAQWAQKWREHHLSKVSSSNELSVEGAFPPPSSGFFTTLKQLTGKLKISLIDSEEENENLLLESFPLPIRSTLTCKDDGTELEIAEISGEMWGYLIENYPIYIMEVEGSDPLFEQYLRERYIELRKRQLSLQQQGLEAQQNIRSSFIASHSESTSTSILLGNGDMTDEEILLTEEITQLQQEISSTEQELLSLENEINEWLQRPKRDTSRQTNNLPPVSAAKTNFVDLHELERMLDTSTPQEVHPIDVNEFSKMLEKVENNKPLGDEMVETTSQASRDSITDQEDQQQEAVESDKEAESTESVDDRGALEPTNDHDDEVDVKDDQQNLQCPLQQQNDEAPMTIEKDNSCVDASSPETDTLVPSQLISEQSSSIDDDQTLYPRVSSIVLDTIPSPNPEIESQEDLPTH